jgi:hypothetical protein
MPPLRYIDIVDRATDVLDMTRLTVEEFALVVPLLEAAFQAHMAEWRLDGKPRTARRYTTYKNCPLPTPEERLLCILVYLKTTPLQVAHGVMFGLPQGKTNQWIHMLLPLLRTALREHGHAPSRSLQALAARLERPSGDLGHAAAPLFVTMEPTDESAVPKLQRNRKAAIAARKSLTR